MTDYSKSKIYKIVCNITGLIYIGSTSQTLTRRIQDHKKNYKRYLNEKYDFTSSFKIIENNNYDIILVEDFPCEKKYQLHARERYWIENTECVNMFIPTRTHKEWYQDNKEKNKENKKLYQKNYDDNNKEKHKQYREDNKEKIKENNKAYVLKNKEKIKEYQKEYHKAYALKYKEKRKEINEKNKEKIKEYQREYYLKKKISSI
jgi:hypothetical protein